MDKIQGSPEGTEQTKSARRLPARITTVLDEAGAAVAPLVARWDAEAARRNELRTPEHLKELIKAQREYSSARSVERQAEVQRRMARQGSKNPLSGVRRAARTAVKAAHQEKRAATVDLKKARRNYPATLRRRAIQAHAAHAVPAAVATYVLSTVEAWAVWPAATGATSASLITAHALTLWLGHRHPTAAVVDGDGLSAEERQLMERLDPSWWVQHAADRGLAGTVTTPPAITPAGIVVEVRLDGTWTLEKFRAAEANVRALLGARTTLPALIKAGARGGWALLTLRTRSAADSADLRWRPGAAFGVDTVTGEDVVIPLGQRMLIAGRSGSGKSWSARPLLHDASEGDSNVLVIIDLKQVEGRLWDHRARVATTPPEVVELVAELVAEMTERLALIPKGEDTLRPTPERPRITVFVDEGGEVTTAAKDALAGLESIARMGRAPIIDLWWATQKPTMSGTSPGIPAQIAPQLTTVVSLAVSTPTETRTVLGENAQAKGWNADALPAPGYALVRSGPTSQPNPVRTRALSPKDVVALPAARIWRRTRRLEDEATPAARPALRLVKSPAEAADSTPAPAPAEAADSSATPGTNRDRVLSAIAAGAATAKAVGEATGLNKGTVSREVKRLAADGAVHRAEDGTLTVQGGTEATA